MKPMNELREGRTDDERKGFIKGDGFMTGFNEARANCAGNCSVGVTMSACRRRLQ